MKKFLASLLTLMMILTISTVAFAAEKTVSSLP